MCSFHKIDNAAISKKVKRTQFTTVIKLSLTNNPCGAQAGHFLSHCDLTRVLGHLRCVTSPN